MTNSKEPTITSRRILLGDPHACCCYCGSVDRDTLTIEHKVPRSRGGHPKDLSNLEVSCKNCNHHKASLTHDEYVYLMSKPDGHARVNYLNRWLLPQMDPLYGVPRTSEEQQAKAKLARKEHPNAFKFCHIFDPWELDILSFSKNKLNGYRRNPYPVMVS